MELVLASHIWGMGGGGGGGGGGAHAPSVSRYPVPHPPTPPPPVSCTYGEPLLKCMDEGAISYNCMYHYIVNFQCFNSDIRFIILNCLCNSYGMLCTCAEKKTSTCFCESKINRNACIKPELLLLCNPLSKLS